MKTIVTVPAGDERTTFDHLPAGGKDIEIYLPQGQPIVVRRLEVEQEASVSPLSRANPAAIVTRGRQSVR